MFSFHVQILINFTYHFGYKPISTSYESHLFIKGAKNRKTDLGSQFALYLTIAVLPASPLNVGRAI